MMNLIYTTHPFYVDMDSELFKLNLKWGRVQQDMDVVQLINYTVYSNITCLQ